MKTSRIIHVTAYYPPHLGGQEIAVQDLATQLAQIGENVEVVTSDCGAKSGINVEDGVRVVRLKSAEFGHTAVTWGLFTWLLLHTNRDTIVHLHVGQFFTPEVVWAASRFKRFRYIIHMHSDLVPSGPMGKLLPLYKRLFLGREIRGAEVAVTLNNEHRHMLRHDYGYDRKVVTMSNGIDEHFFRITHKLVRAGGLKLLFVGRLSPHKNLTALLEAVSMVKQRITVDIVGDGECRQELELFAKAVGLENVAFHGRLSRTDVMNFYATSDAVILPSLYEVQGMVLLEAMASRTPIIATRGLGMELGAHEAILIESTALGIMDGLMRFAALSPDAQKSLVDAAFERAQGLRWHTLIPSYVRLYKEVADGIGDLDC